MVGNSQETLLQTIAGQVRTLRAKRQLSRRRLAEISGISIRFLAQVESGTANISVLRLQEIAQSLGVSFSVLLQPVRDSRPCIALLGLRGAGKSTVGKQLAQRLEVPFYELDHLVEEKSGLPLQQIFELQGEAYYRELEREVLSHFIVEFPRAVLATGGGVINDPHNYALLRGACTTVWLHAKPEDHWDRVVQQGDERPMRGNPRAMHELRILLRARESLYAQADHRVETSHRSVQEITEELFRLLHPSSVVS